MTFIFRTCKKSDVMFFPQQKEITHGKTRNSILKTEFLKFVKLVKLGTKFDLCSPYEVSPCCMFFACPKVRGAFGDFLHANFNNFPTLFSLS